jgi:hypothetical protein
MKAFPVPNSDYQDGMDLRDYFAAKAMQADITNYENNSKFGPDFWSTENIAKRAYNMADAMIKARGK